MADEINIHRQRAMERMTEDEYRSVFEAKKKELDVSSEKTKRIIYIVLGILSASVAATIITAIIIAGSEGEGLIFTWLVVLPVIISMFLFDPKLEEDKRPRYETDRFILINAIENKLKLNRIRQIGVIVMGVLFAVIEGIVWSVIITFISYE